MTQQAEPQPRGGSQQDTLDHPWEGCRRVLVLSALLGLLSGFGEAVIDMLTPPFSPPDVLYATVIANLLLFLLVGLVFWVIGLGLKQELAYFLVTFILLWALLRGWESEFAPRAKPDFIWLASFVGTSLLAAPPSIWVWKHTQKAARIASQTLPWVAAIALMTIAIIPLYRVEARARAMQSAPKAAGTLPNVLFIVVDDLRADHLSCYGYERSTSPSIDQLASKGVLFSNAIATSSWTLPSHASMLTGLYPKQHRAQRFRDRLGAGVPTLGEELARVGYRTGAFSGSPFFTPRQGLGRGFMEFRDFYVSPTQAFIQAHDIHSILDHFGAAEWVDRNLGHPSAIDINASLVKWIDTIHAPFFVVLNYFEVHEPNSIPRPQREGFASQRWENSISGGSKLTVSQVTPQVRNKIDGYDGAIAYDDDRLQKLIDELSRRHLTDNMLLIVTADHGEGLGEHGLLDHGTSLYYPMIHVPLVFYWPGHLPAGVRVSLPVSTKDIAATILELLDVNRTRLPGKSLAPLWSAQVSSNQWPMPLSELVLDRLHTGGLGDPWEDTESIISPEFQLILDSRQGPSLYNWQRDSEEKDNLFLAPRYESVSRALGAKLKNN